MLGIGQWIPPRPSSRIKALVDACLSKIHTTQKNCFCFQILRPQFGHITGQPFEWPIFFRTSWTFFICLSVTTILVFATNMCNFNNEMTGENILPRAQTTNQNWWIMYTSHNLSYKDIHTFATQLTKFDTVAYMTYYHTNLLSKKHRKYGVAIQVFSEFEVVLWFIHFWFKFKLPVSQKLCLQIFLTIYCIFFFFSKCACLDKNVSQEVIL